MSKNKKIVLDFDDTLFDDTRFMIDLFSIFINHGAKKEDLAISYKKTKAINNFWDPVVQARLLFGSVKEGLIEDMANHFENSSRYIFDDVKEFLEKNEGEKVILSYGDPKTQLAKIKNSKIDKYFQSIIITSDRLKEGFFSEQKSLSNTYFLDNLGKIVDSVKSSFPSVHCTLVVRPQTRYSKEKSKLADRVVSNLLFTGENLKN